MAIGRGGGDGRVRRRSYHLPAGIVHRSHCEGSVGAIAIVIVIGFTAWVEDDVHARRETAWMR